MRAGRILSALIVAGASGFATVALAQQPSPRDVAFATQAALRGMIAVEASKIALQKTSDARVRRFAQRMADDHTIAADALRSAASRENIAVPRMLDPEHQKDIDRLQSLSRPQFDAAYRSQMLKDHSASLVMFEDEARGGGKSALQRFAADSLPRAKHRLQMAQELADSASGSRARQ